MARYIIYILIISSVAFPIITKYSFTPSRMKMAEKAFELVEKIDLNEKKSIALFFMDFGPSTKAENEPQSEVILEHLFRKRIPVVLYTQTPQGESFLKEIPDRIIKRLKKEYPEKSWKYGEDWVNLGYQPGKSLFVQGLAKSKDLPKYFGKDVFGKVVSRLPIMEGIKTIHDVSLVAEFTGLVGLLDTYIQFLQTTSYTPPILHGCTSITIPEAYIFLDSGQLRGLLEGLSGAAWYSEQLKLKFPKREPDTALVTNTALGIAQLTLLLLIIAGNLMPLKNLVSSKV
jgi:hypothetical protein